MRLTVLTLAVMLWGAIACSAAGNLHKVIAVVNGVEITASQVSHIDIDQLDPEKKKQLIDSLIFQQLLMEKAVKEGFNKQEHIVAEIRSMTKLHIVTKYMAELAAGFNVSDEELRLIYDKEYSSSTTRYKTSHILLTTEEEGRALIAKLSKARGDDFPELAAQHSQDRVSAKKGGDLGWLSEKDMVPPFYRVISELHEGEVSRSPVQTPFGWHVLKLDGIRADVPSSFEKVKKTIRQELIEKKMHDYLDNLKSSATIEISP